MLAVRSAMNLSELLDSTASHCPGKPALIEGDAIISYGALLEQVTAMSSRMHALGLPPACRVGLCCSNSVNYVVLTFSLWRINAVVVPVPMECVERELADLATIM